MKQPDDNRDLSPVSGTRRSYDPLTGRSLATSPARQPAPFRSKAIVVTLETPDRRVKVFRIDWLKREVGFSVGLPYFSPSHAVLGRYELRVPPGGEAQPLAAGKRKGDETACEVVVPQERRSLVFLDWQDRIGHPQSIAAVGWRATHLFSIYVRGPGGFAPTDDKDGHPGRCLSCSVEPQERRTRRCRLQDHRPVVGAFAPGTVRSEPEFEGRPNFVHLQTRDGGAVSGFLFSQIPTWPWGGYGLLLSQEPWSIETGHPHPYVLVQGGFGQPSRPGEPDAGDTFLAAMYTDRSAEIDDLTRSLGSVDIQAASIRMRWTGGITQNEVVGTSARWNLTPSI